MAKQQNAYYQLVAQNFLRNISLDGSHQDTALKIFNEKGLQTQITAAAPRPDNFNGALKDHHHHHHHHHGKRTSNEKYFSTRRKSDVRRSPSTRSKNHRRFGERLWSSSGASSDQSHEGGGGILSKLTSKFSSTDQHHHPKINWNIPTTTSEESLAKASILSPKGELKIMFPHVKDSNLVDGRVCMCNRQIPAVIFSVIPYKIQIADKDVTVDTRSAVSFEDVGLKPFTLKVDEEISYSPLLVPSKSASTLYTSSVASSMDSTQLSCATNNVKSISTEILMAGGGGGGDTDSNLLNRSFQYDANMLDNSEFGAGKHKATLTFTSFVSSIIDYVDPNDLKKEVNEKFKKRFPELRLSYSKYRSLKSEMKEIASTVSMDLLTLSHAYVYFDKIVLKAFINKLNRKYLAGVSLILAAKMNDVKGMDLKILIQKIEETFRVTKRDLFEYELPAAVALEFTLHIPVSELSSQYQKLLQSS